MIPSKFVDLPASMFPFTIEMVRMDTMEVIDTMVVEGPGGLTVPGLGRQLGVEIGCRMRFPGGAETTSW